MLAVVVAAGLVAVMLSSASLRPELKERDILIQLEAAPGTSLPRMDAITAAMVDDLRAIEGVDNVGAHVGRAILSDQVVNVNAAEIWLDIDPDADYSGTLDLIEWVAARQGDVAANVTTYSDQRVTAILDQRADELVVRVYGENPDLRRTMAEELRTAMIGVDGIGEATVELPLEEPTVEIEVDLDTAQAFGVKPGDVRRQAATLVSGLIVGNLFEDQKVFDVVVWGVPEIRNTVDDLGALPIATPSGDQVPLGDLADVRVVSNPAVIRHESVATYLDVTATVTGRPIGDAAAEVDEAIAGMTFPLEHHAEVLGAFADVEAAQSRVLAAVAAGLVLVYLLLQAAFASWRLATLAILTLPMAIAGSFIAVALTGGEIGLGSVAGIGAMLALAIHWVILSIRGYLRREKLGEPFGPDQVLEGTADTFVPVAISAVAIVALFLPLIVFGSRAGLEMAGPAAVAVVGGMGTTLLLTLVVLPALYLRWGYAAERDTSAEGLFTAETPVETGVGV